MKGELDAILQRWGQDVTREVTGESWRAFVQPVRQKNRQEERMVTPVGDVDQRRWLYIGPGEIPLSWEERLLCGGERFFVRECAAVNLGEKTLYQRAILVKEKEAAV